MQLLRSFTDLNDDYGRDPDQPVTLDSAGNVYGTTLGAGLYGDGVVFELTRSSTAPWPETVLYAFSGGTDGGDPSSPLVFDSAGNLYGATDSGGILSDCTLSENGPGCGVIFKLTPYSGGTWTETVLYSFTGGADGAEPGSVVLDSVGNLYGATYAGGLSDCQTGGYAMGCGVIFKLTPTGSGPWQEEVLHTFEGGADGANPWSVTLDSSGSV